jgi:AraC-like DNA-binding protein
MHPPAYFHLAAAAEPGVEVLSARFYGHAYDRHFHEAYAVGITEAGAQAFRARGTRHVSVAGTVIVIPPGEPHDGEAGDSRGFSYRMLYLPQRLVLDLLRDSTERSVAPPHPPSFLIRDTRLARAVRRAAAILPDTGATALARHEATAQVVHELARIAGSPSDFAVRGGVEARAVARVRERLADCLAENATIESLAQEAGLSRFRLTRAFTRMYGMPPHAFLMSLRLNSARRRLAGEGALGQIAVACGFTDQAHLTREFRRRFGLTPGAYRESMRT